MYALINTKLLQFIKYVDNCNFVCKDGFSVVPILIQPKPEYDKFKQKLIPNRIIQEDKILEDWVIDDLSEEVSNLLIQEETEKTYKESIEKGYTVPKSNIVLGLTDAHRSNYASQLLFLSCVNSSDVFIFDINNNLHSIPAKKFKEIIVSYYEYYNSILRQKYNYKK